jgi:galactonate dehydratase
LVVDTGQGRNFLFVIAETDDGVTGVGEGSQSGQDLAVAANVAHLREQYVGRSIFELVEPLSLVTRSRRSGRAMTVAVSAIEQATWDCIGKHLGVPLYQLLGGAVHERIPCYATLAAGVDSQEPGVIGAEAVACVEAGFRAVKVVAFPELRGGPGVGPPLVDDGDVLELGQSRLRAVREAIGPEVGLIVECALTLDRVTLARLGPFLEAMNCLWVEAPLIWDDPHALASVRAHSRVRIASGEVGHGRLDSLRLIAEQSVDVLQPDVKWAGGILEVRKIAAWAEAHQIAVALHNNSGLVATAASAHLSVVLPNALILEVPSRHPAWERTQAGGDSLVVDGHVERSRLGASPGLGIELDESKIPIVM